MRQVEIECNHRSQKENFRFVDLKMLYVNFSFNSRRFVLLFRDLSRENFRFVDLKMFYVNFSVNSRRFVLLFRDFSLRELHILTILFCLLAYFDEQSVSTKRLTSVN